MVFITEQFYKNIPQPSITKLSLKITNDLNIRDFQMMVAGYILAVHQHLEEEQFRNTPGNTPVRRRGQSSQSQQVSEMKGIFCKQ